MTIEELNKLIKEELDAFFEEEEGGDDVTVTTDEPAAKTGEEALDLLQQIYDMIKPQIEDEGEVEEPEMDAEEPAEDEGEEEGEEPAEEEEGDAEPEEEEDLEKISEAVGGPSPEELVTLIMSMGIPAAMMAAAGGKPKLTRLISAAGSNVKKRLQAVKTFLAGIPTDVKGTSDDAEIEEHTIDRGNYKAEDTIDVGYNAEKIKGGLNESVDMTARFKKLANIKG